MSALPNRLAVDFRNVRDPLDDFLDTVVGPGSGYLAVEFGHGPKIEREWKARTFAWPEEREQARRLITEMQHKRWDVYTCPALRKDRSRSRHNAADIWTLSFELDDAPADPELLDKLDAVTVQSSTEDHTHNHVLLAEPVDDETSDRLTEAIAKAVAGWKPGSGVALKYEANALLRAPDTWNWKSFWAPDRPARRRDDDAAPRRVRVVKPEGKRWTLDELEALIASLATATPVPKRRQGARVRSAQAMTEDQLRALPGVQRALALWGGVEKGKLSDAHNAVGRECYKANAPQDVTVALLLSQPWCKGDMDWVTRDVAAIYAKAEREGLPQMPTAEFWDSRPILTHIRKYAAERAMPPWAMLGHTLLRVAANIPPCYVLPDIVGDYGSLNLFVALVGPPGGGKTTSRSASKRAVVLPYEPLQVPPSTGQGIRACFAERGKDGLVPISDSVIFDVDEVSRFREDINRPGSTLLGELNTAWAGSTLGSANADAARRVVLPSHTYRLGMHIGVQPKLVDALLQKEGSGFPQRFVWFQAQLPEATQRPRERTAGAWVWTPPRLVDRGTQFDREPSTDEFEVIGLPDFVEDLVWDDHIKRGAGQVGEIETHRMLSRLKIAAVLMFMDGRTDAVNAGDWHLSGQIMAHSDSVLEQAQQFYAAHLAEEAAMSATRTGRRQAITEGAKEVEMMKKARVRILQLLAGGQEKTRSSVVTRGMTVSLREYADAALDELKREGKVKVWSTKHPTTDKTIVRCRLTED